MWQVWINVSIMGNCKGATMDVPLDNNLWIDHEAAASVSTFVDLYKLSWQSELEKINLSNLFVNS